MRTFIAIDFSPEIKARVAELVRRLAPLGRGVKWVAQDSMHLTLKFLGEIDDALAARVKDVLRPVAARFGPLPLKLQGAGSFPPGSPSPRVLWVGLAAPPELARLQDAIEVACESVGLAREERPFAPHLTLGRVKSPGGLAGLMDELERSRSEPFGEMTARGFRFYRSRLHPSGAEYSVLEEFAFQ